MYRLEQEHALEVRVGSGSEEPSCDPDDVVGVGERAAVLAGREVHLRRYRFDFDSRYILSQNCVHLDHFLYKVKSFKDLYVQNGSKLRSFLREKSIKGPDEIEGITLGEITLWEVTLGGVTAWGGEAGCWVYRPGFRV